MYSVNQTAHNVIETMVTEVGSHQTFTKIWNDMKTVIRYVMYGRNKGPLSTQSQMNLVRHPVNHSSFYIKSITEEDGKRAETLIQITITAIGATAILT